MKTFSTSSRKRVFTPSILSANLKDFMLISPSLPGTFMSGRISPVFRERILLVVTSVNQCRYCEWMHSDLAEVNGMSKIQIQMLLNQDLSEFPEEEMPALMYALHFAQSNCQPESDQTQSLYEIYGKEKAKDIENFIKLIFFSNLSGNTFDSFLSRLKGEPNPEGNLFFELFFSLLSAPVLLAVAATSKSKVNPLGGLKH